MSRLGSMKQMCEDCGSITDFTQNGECSGCGNCCGNILPISDVEIKRIRVYVKNHDIKEQVCRFPTSEPIIDMQCPFRDESARRCTIYPARPAICRDFRCDKPKKKILADKAMYHGKYSPVDMRSVFFGRKSFFAQMMEEIANGTK